MGSHGVSAKFNDSSNEERKEEKRLRDLESKDYKEFDDNAIKSPLGGSKEYYGDGQKQVDFFDENSNYNEIIKNMTPSEREAV